MNEFDFSLLEELCNLQAPSGKESAVSSFLSSRAGLFGLEFYSDAMGNLLFCRSFESLSKKPTVIMAHMDEVGFVSYKNHINNIFVFPLSRLAKESVDGARVSFLNGVTGVISCNNDSLETDSAFYVQVDDTSNLDIPSYATFSPNYQYKGELIEAKSLDDRIGCFIILSAIEQATIIDQSIVFVFTTQEELENRGAKFVSQNIKPGRVIVIDTTPSSTNQKRTSVTIGNGVAIKVLDAGTVIPEHVVNTFLRLAKEENVPAQLEVVNRGNTDIQPFLLSGVSWCGALSIPCENGHTATETVSMRDVIAAISIVKKIIEGLE